MKANIFLKNGIMIKTLPLLLIIQVRAEKEFGGDAVKGTNGKQELDKEQLVMDVHIAKVMDRSESRILKQVKCLILLPLPVKNIIFEANVFQGVV